MNQFTVNDIIVWNKKMIDFLQRCITKMGKRNTVRIIQYHAHLLPTRSAILFFHYLQEI